VAELLGRHPTGQENERHDKSADQQRRGGRQRDSGPRRSGEAGGTAAPARGAGFLRDVPIWVCRNGLLGQAEKSGACSSTARAPPSVDTGDRLRAGERGARRSASASEEAGQAFRARQSGRRPAERRPIQVRVPGGPALSSSIWRLDGIFLHACSLRLPAPDFPGSTAAGADPGTIFFGSVHVPYSVFFGDRELFHLNTA
jgi:hypothetical protein